VVDRAAHRVLLQKCELGLLDPGWDPAPAALSARGLPDGVAGAPGNGGAAAGPDRALPGSAPVGIDLDPPAARALAREIAEESVVLLANDGLLPLPPAATVAVVGPLADDPMGMLGCYAFPSHTGRQHPTLPPGVDIPTVLAALRAELPAARIEHAAGCAVDGTDTAGLAAASAAAAAADVCVAVLGDVAGLFGRGTSGEGCDAPDLRLPGVQADLLEALLRAGTPVVLVLLTGRPYALGAVADRLGAAVQAFFPGEEGGPAVAGVLSGRVNPGGRLPVSVPRSSGGQPATYLAPKLGQHTDVSTVDPTPLYPFGHGLSYTTFDWSDVQVDGRQAAAEETVQLSTDGCVSVSVAVRNTGDRAGAEVVQLYLHDPVAQVTRPVVRLIGYGKLRLQPGEVRRIGFDVHADLASFSGRSGRRVVEPGDLELRLAASSVDAAHPVRLRLVGPERVVDHRRRLVAPVTVR